MNKTKEFYKLIFKTLLVTIVISLSLIILKFYFSHLFTSKHYGFGVLKDKSPIDLFIIGSSHSRQSYHIKEIEDKCQCNVKMLSYSGLDPYFMVPIISYVKNNYKVKKWIVETYSFKLVAPPKISDSRIITDAPPEVKIDLLKRQFNLTQDFSKIYNLLTLENNESLFMAPVTYFMGEKFSYNGGSINKVARPMTPEDFQSSGSYVDQFKEMKHHPLQTNSILQIREILTDQDVLYLDPPMPHPVLSHPITQRLMLDFKVLIPTYQSPWFKLEPSLAPAFFTDWNHLSTKGRNLYTKMILNMLSLFENSK